VVIPRGFFETSKTEMNLILKLIESPWFWADVVLSVIGGLLVYWGLLIEKESEKYIPPADFKRDIFDDIVKAQKSKLDRGWRILMAGIIIEVVAALLISIISGLEMASLNDKAEQASERAANTESNNLVLQARVLVLTAQMQEMTNSLAVVGKTANDTRDLLGQSNTTAVLSETKIVLAEASKVATDVRSIVANSNLVSLKIASADRIITTEKSEKFIKLLQNVPRGPVTVFINGNSGGEVQNYAEQIRVMIGSAGYDVGKMCAMGWGSGQIPKGIFIVVKSVNFHPPYAVCLMPDRFKTL
jgi:hypothetical protein